MAKHVQQIGHEGLEAENYTGRNRQLTVDLTKQSLRVHDGITPGGSLLITQAISDKLSDKLSEMMNNALNTAIAALTTRLDAFDEKLGEIPTLFSVRGPLWVTFEDAQVVLQGSTIKPDVYIAFDTITVVEAANAWFTAFDINYISTLGTTASKTIGMNTGAVQSDQTHPTHPCLLYTSPSPRDRQKSRMPSSA